MSSPVSKCPRQKSTVQDGTRHRWAAVLIQSRYGFACGRHDAAWQGRSGNPQDWDLGCLKATGWAQESLAFLDAAVQLLHVRGVVCGALSCWNTKSLPDTLRIVGSSMMSLWRREAALKKSVRDITRISCFVKTIAGRAHLPPTKVFRRLSE